MKTHSLSDILFKRGNSGMNISVLCFSTLGVISFLTMSLLCFIRFIREFYFAAAAYAILAFMFFIFVLAVVYCIRKDSSVINLEKFSFPLVIGCFIYGFTILFFLDGGLHGAVPIFFVLSVVATPFLFSFSDSLIMVILEILAYVTNILFSVYFPESIDPLLANPSNAFIPAISVALILSFLCFIYTYSYRKQQERLGHALTEADAANEAKSSFLDNMSHEIRTPMNSILGMNEMILREENRPEIREYALVIQRSGRALLGIINDILDFSKLQDRKMEIVPVRYDLSSLINDLINMAAEQAKKKSLTFTVNVDKEIPRILDGDEYHIRQVMMNILNNAIKYTEQGGVTITIGYESVDSYTIQLKCSVSDTGIGIKTEDLELIFQPFEHIESTRKFSSDGSGLGLSIVKQLLELMGSGLKVESVFHKGSTFSFNIKQTVIKWEPIGDYEQAFTSAREHQERAFTQTFIAPEAKVLVVDDADVNLLVFANLLKKTKIKIDTASSGVEMLQMVRMNHYNMIFLDHRMPGMDGIEAFHNMKKMTDGLNFNTPVVALTANAVLGARQLYIDEGFSDYISKPVDTVRLEQILLEYLPPDLVIKCSDTQNEEEPDETVETDETSVYKKIPGINYEAAITNCGSEDTFIQALEIFYNTLDKKAGDIERFEREKDIKNYTVLVHALKSAARLVGALKLSDDAKYLEACGDKQDIAEIEAKTPALLSQYRGYKPVLEKVFGKKDEPDMSLPEMSVEDLHEMYSLIKGFAADFDLDNIDSMIAETKNYRIPEAERDKFEKVKECVTNADWGTLEELLSSMSLNER